MKIPLLPNKVGKRSRTMVMKGRNVLNTANLNPLMSRVSLVFHTIDTVRIVLKLQRNKLLQSRVFYPLFSNLNNT